MEVYDALDLLSKAEALAKANAFPHRDQRYQEVAKKRRWGKVTQPRRMTSSAQSLKQELEEAKAIQAARQTTAPAMIDLDVISKAFEFWRGSLVGKTELHQETLVKKQGYRDVTIPPRPPLPPIEGHVDVLMAELEAIAKDIERRNCAKKKQG